MNKLQEKIITNRISKNELKLYYDNNIENVVMDTNFNIYKDLELLKDIDKGTNLLLEAMENNKLIVISCDFDADGIPGCKVLIWILNNLLKYQKSVIPVIGGRKFGRGLCQNVVNKLKKIKTVLKEDIGLLITIDHGTVDNSAYEELKTYYPNMKIILTDHHRVEYDNYPNSVDAFINPQRNDSEYSKKICGNMTSFLLGIYTHYKKTGVQDIRCFEPIIPYVCISTIADVMSMKERLNRYIIQYGLEIINRKEDDRINRIINELDIMSDVTYQDVAMSIAPLINTGNRLEAEVSVLAGLLIDKKEKYNKYISHMIELNKYRKAELNNIMVDILTDLHITNDDFGIIIILNNTKSMVAGIVAGNISGMYNKPSICFTNSGNNILTGSGRSGIENLDVLSIIKNIEIKTSDIIVTAHGHSSAFGISINRDRLHDFRMIFNTYCKQVIEKMEIKPLIHEFEINTKDINISLARSILLAGPYGLEYNNPIFLIKNLILIDIIPIRTFFKLRFNTQDGLEPLSAMFFFRNKTKLNLNFNNFTTIIKKNSRVDILANISTNTYRNKSFVSLDVIDIIPKDLNN